MTEPTPAFPPIAQLMPHGPPIRALEQLVEWAPGRAVCTLTVRESMPFVRDGAVASVVLVEWMAQAVAVCLGYEAYVGGEGVRVGMLVGIRKMTLHVPTLPCGSLIRIEVDRLRGSEDVSTFSGVARIGDTLLASARMTLFHADQPPD